jgi:hypothetical protein
MAESRLGSYSGVRTPQSWRSATPPHSRGPRDPPKQRGCIPLTGTRKCARLGGAPGVHEASQAPMMNQSRGTRLPTFSPVSWTAVWDTAQAPHRRRGDQFERHWATDDESNRGRELLDSDPKFGPIWCREHETSGRREFAHRLDVNNLGCASRAPHKRIDSRGYRTRSGDLERDDVRPVEGSVRSCHRNAKDRLPLYSLCSPRF